MLLLEAPLRPGPNGQYVCSSGHSISVVCYSRSTVDDSEAESSKHGQVFFWLVNFLTKTYKNHTKTTFFEVVTGSSYCVSHHFGA